ncbi:unnamed protein product [Dibothriocephalus latus]|uniref:Uncharacterized protein n=1 Tax=Dibothriocephalus latus TaxID=60516 RepID=A0A3P7LMQ7_DIBLA|nr:unnamed protein product [Dibothriocephalus latus]
MTLTLSWRFSVDQMLDFCSWLFISIGFCTPILCFLCLPTNKHVEIGPAATDAFLYGLIFGLLKSFQGAELDTCLGSAPAPILFGLVGLLLVQIEQNESFDTQDKDDIVFVI